MVKQRIIYGSHRSHGEILAKGLSAIRRLSETDLQEIMESYLGGDILRVVERIPASGLRERAYRVVAAAGRLQKEFGLSAEIVDARSLVPFDYAPVLESVQKTGRLLVTSDACERGSFAQSFAATIQELAFDALDAPAICVGARNWITPAAELEELFFPQPAWLLDAIHTHLRPLPGYQPMQDFTRDARIRAEREGV